MVTLATGIACAAVMVSVSPPLMAYTSPATALDTMDRALNAFCGDFPSPPAVPEVFDSQRVAVPSGSARHSPRVQTSPRRQSQALEQVYLPLPSSAVGRGTQLPVAPADEQIWLAGQSLSVAHMPEATHMPPLQTVNGFPAQSGVVVHSGPQKPCAVHTVPA